MFVLVPLGIGAMGLFFCFLGIARLRRERAFTRGALGAQGIVVGFARRRHVTHAQGHRGVGYRDHPVVSYTTRDGQETQFESPIGTSPRLQREGQQVPILYNPANPTDARIATGCMQYGLPIFFIIFGLAMALFAATFGAFAWFLIIKLPAS